MYALEPEFLVNVIIQWVRMNKTYKEDIEKWV